jgi:hypothetical protein
MGSSWNNGQASAGDLVSHEFGVCRWGGHVQFTDDDLGGASNLFLEWDGIGSFGHCH